MIEYQELSGEPAPPAPVAKRSAPQRKATRDGDEPMPALIP